MIVATWVLAIAAVIGLILSTVQYRSALQATRTAANAAADSARAARDTARAQLTPRLVLGVTVPKGRDYARLGIENHGPLDLDAVTIVIRGLLPPDMGSHPLSGLADVPGREGDAMLAGACAIGPLAVGERKYVNAARAAGINGGAGPVRVESVAGDAEWKQRYNVNVPARPFSVNVSPD